MRRASRSAFVRPCSGCCRSHSLGVVTFNQPQQALIASLLDARRMANPQLDKAIAQVMQEPLFRDRLRQHVLEGLGWRIHRIWSTDWWMNPEREFTKLLTRLEFLLNEPSAGDTVAVSDVTVAGAPAEERAESGASLKDPVAAMPAALKPYALTILPKGVPEDFHGSKASSILREHIVAVVNIEGPVLDSVLFKRVARAWGLERTGPRIVERLRGLAPSSIIKTVDGERTFYWPAESQPFQWSEFRVAGHDEQSRRHIDEVALEEIGALMRHVLEEAGGSSRPRC